MSQMICNFQAFFNQFPHGIIGVLVCQNKPWCNQNNNKMQENITFNSFLIFSKQLFQEKQKRSHRHKRARCEKCKWVITPHFHECHEFKGFPCFTKISTCQILSRVHISSFLELHRTSRRLPFVRFCFVQ